MSSAKAEDYIKAVYQLGDGDEPVAPSTIAEALGVTTPTVTATMKRLADQGLVEREEYKGSHLTEDGELLAVETIRHHRLLELFLTEQLNYDWSEVHDEADRLEHHISEKLETELAAALDEPTVDPHGSPIPTADLATPEGDHTPLCEYDEGEVVIVAEVADRDAAVLEYLADAGITPGTRVEITEIAPFGMVTVVTDENEETISLPEDTAATVRVREASPDQPDNGDVLVG
ncbi:metal-dependent transcriptional regulator [Halococcus agarilyticus]|uniref:metal-dependent transcriptional regulator n=1 Tax=Halococcus agarilyticus TaxID=1232219 RepID=UPI000677D919|nr:metal-dependent transcriptional regulator [Halococcus agarilyticus]